LLEDAALVDHRPESDPECALRRALRCFEEAAALATPGDSLLRRILMEQGFLMFSASSNAERLLALSAEAKLKADKHAVALKLATETKLKAKRKAEAHVGPHLTTAAGGAIASGQEASREQIKLDVLKKELADWERTKSELAVKNKTLRHKLRGLFPSPLGDEPFKTALNSCKVEAKLKTKAVDKPPESSKDTAVADPVAEKTDSTNTNGDAEPAPHVFKRFFEAKSFYEEVLWLCAHHARLRSCVRT